VPVLEPQIGTKAWPCDTAQAKAIHIDVDAKNHQARRLWPSLEARSRIVCLRRDNAQRVDGDGHPSRRR
jgi:hypothetical protein